MRDEAITQSQGFPRGLARIQSLTFQILSIATSPQAQQDLGSFFAPSFFQLSPLPPCSAVNRSSRRPQPYRRHLPPSLHPSLSLSISLYFISARLVLPPTTSPWHPTSSRLFRYMLMSSPTYLFIALYDGIINPLQLPFGQARSHITPSSSFACREVSES